MIDAINTSTEASVNTTIAPETNNVAKMPEEPTTAAFNPAVE